MDLKTYAAAMADVMQRIPTHSVDESTRVLLDAYERDATIFVIGNGGSATTATHFALDIAKNPVPDAKTRRVRCVALTDNIAALTAWANDTSYDHIFEEQMGSLWRPGDVLLVITGSGNSPNVVRAVEWANAHAGTTVGLLGRGGGRCASLCHATVDVPHMDYGLIETVHLAVCHFWVDTFREHLKQTALISQT
ncbi:MAG: SIS domain-containing protein [Anaerolineae bacterium]